MHAKKEELGTLERVNRGLRFDSSILLSAAARAAAGFRTLFNLPESIALLRGHRDHLPYWRLVLQHGIEGNLQSLLDEQVHILMESLGVVEQSVAERTDAIARELEDALSIRTAQLRVDDIQVDRESKSLKIHPFNNRCRFALRFGDLKDDNDATLARADVVRTAFNSPFRPFILASTSIGQEGLDFHTWCHAVVHWNLVWSKNLSVSRYQHVSTYCR